MPKIKIPKDEEVIKRVKLSSEWIADHRKHYTYEPDFGWEAHDKIYVCNVKTGKCYVLAHAYAYHNGYTEVAIFHDRNVPKRIRNAALGLISNVGRPPYRTEKYK